MIQESNVISLRRGARIADMAGGLVEELPGRILDARFSTDVPNDEQRGAVRCPVGLLDVLGHISRRAAGQSGAGEGAGAYTRMVRAAVDGDGHLARRRDTEQVGARKLQRERVG